MITKKIKRLVWNYGFMRLYENGPVKSFLKAVRLTTGRKAHLNRKYWL